MWFSVLVFNLYCCIATAIIHDLYEGAPPTQENLEKFKRENNLERCTIEFEPCDENEYSRIDGSCNNLKYPSRGPIFTPLTRLLPSNYSENYEPRRTKSGKPLPLARKSRSRLLDVGENIGQELTMSVSYYMEYVTGDTTSIHDVENYLYNITNRCEPEGKNTYWCTPIEVPANDHVHVMIPLLTEYHNKAADYLAKLNPCWDDDKLFHVARDITISYYNQMLFYEFYALILGRERLIEAGVLQDDTGFRYIYNENLIPQLDVEFPYITRWFHRTQSAMLKLYDKDGYFIKERSIVNYTLRCQDLAYDDNMVGLTHGAYLQSSGQFKGYSVDPEMSEVALGQYFHAFDVPSADLNNGKFLGLAPYIHYRDYCTNYTKNHTKFEDLRDVIPADILEELQEIYEEPEDMEVMAGCWAEKLLGGTWVTPTVHCVMVKQLKKIIAYDRHWFESPNRPHKHSYEQLQEIRKASLAGLMCHTGDDVTHIQRHAFQRISKENPKVSCAEIPQVNLDLWKDDSCNECS